MMAIDSKQLSEAERVDLTRCFAKAEKGDAQRRLEAGLLAAAGKHVEGERRWFALRTAHRSEIELRDSLMESGVDAVVPVKEVVKTRRGCRPGSRVIHKPVLANLVFVRMVGSNDGFAGLLRVKGVAAVIGRDGIAHPIGDREMNGFMHLAERGAFDERLMPQGLVVGSKVRIGVGPYADFEGVLEGYAPSRGARVLTWLFGREMVVEVTLAQIEKVD